MKKTKNIFMLDLGRTSGSMHPTLIVDENQVLLADVGLPHQVELLESELQRLGYALSQVTAILITHHDLDHMGCLKEIKALYPQIEIMAHRAEAPFIDGSVPSLKVQDIESGRSKLQPDQQAWFENLKTSFPKLAVEVDTLLEDKDVLDIADGLEVIWTPGHTLGHVSLYHHASKTLISGDALNMKDGIVSGPNPRFTHDMDQGLASVRKLAEFDIQRVIIYHGGLLEKDRIQDDLKKIAG